MIIILTWIYGDCNISIKWVILLMSFMMAMKMILEVSIWFHWYQAYMTETLYSSFGWWNLHALQFSGVPPWIFSVQIMIYMYTYITLFIFLYIKCVNVFFPSCLNIRRAWNFSNNLGCSLSIDIVKNYFCCLDCLLLFFFFTCLGGFFCVRPSGKFC